MNRRVTHIKKLHNCQSDIDRFFSVFSVLHQKIGVILIQLPPSLSFNITRLSEFIDRLPEQYRYAFEFRNTSWYNSETYELLKMHHFAFCIHDMYTIETPRIVTSDFIYIRFHGHNAVYGGNYPDQKLQEWATWIKSHHDERKSIFGYFNNDIDGFAVRNCIRLKELIR